MRKLPAEKWVSVGMGSGSGASFHQCQPGKEEKTCQFTAEDPHGEPEQKQKANQAHPKQFVYLQGLRKVDHHISTTNYWRLQDKGNSEER